MPHYLELDETSLRRSPLILLVPGHRDSGPGHWLSMWEAQCRDCQRVDLGMWDDPHRNTWVNKLNMAIHRAHRPIILVAHDLGCLAVAWWAEYEQPSRGNPVVGALFAAPPDVDRPGRDPRLAKFGSCPRNPLPFPAFVAVSEDDPSCPRRTAQMLANDWECRLALTRGEGHIDRAAGVGGWHFGKVLLGQLLSEHRATWNVPEPVALPLGASLPDASYAPTVVPGPWARRA